MAATTTEPAIGQTRNTLAYATVGAGMLGITLISWVAISQATDGGRPEMSRLVFASILPLLGTWVGAVLAYYFSKDNLQAATQTTLDAVRAADRSQADTQVTTLMIPVNRIRPREDPATEDAAKALRLRDLYSKMTSSGMSRVPVFIDGRAVFVVHEPDIDSYAQANGLKSADLDDTHLIETLLADTALAGAITTFAAVAGTATVAEARAALAKLPDAKDVFVTDDGQPKGRVLGWLTHSDLARS